MPKLIVNGKEEQAKKKVKLYREIPSARVRKILEDPKKLEELKEELREKRPE